MAPQLGLAKPHSSRGRPGLVAPGARGPRSVSDGEWAHRRGCGGAHGSEGVWCASGRRCGAGCREARSGVWGPGSTASGPSPASASARGRPGPLRFCVGPRASQAAVRPAISIPSCVAPPPNVPAHGGPGLRPPRHPGPAREPGCLGAGGHEPLRASPSRAVLTGKLRLRRGGTCLGGEQGLGCCPEGACAHSRPRAGLSPDPCPRAPAPSPDPKPVSPASLREPGRALASPPGLPLGSPRAPAVPSSALPLDALAQSPRSSGVEGGALGHQAK